MGRKSFAQENADLKIQLAEAQRQLSERVPAPLPEPIIERASVAAVLTSHGLRLVLQKLLPAVDIALDGPLEAEDRSAFDLIRTGIRGL